MNETIEHSQTPRSVLVKVLNALSELEQTGEQHIYFSGEGDSSQTKFERLSNRLKVGVIARNDVVGKALLRLVRMIIDRNQELLSWDIEETLEENTHPTVRALIEYLVETESEYGKRFGLEETFTTILYKRDEEVIIKKTLSAVDDVWTLDRVKKEIVRLF